jgi:hypothetical protein
MIGEPSGHELYYPRYDCRDFDRFVLWNISVRTVKSIGSNCEIYRFVLWNISVRITILPARTVKYIGSYHNSIGPYREIYRFVSHFYRVVLWNLSVRITILSGRTVKSIGSNHNSIGPYCEIYRFVSQLYRAVLWNLSVRITFLSGHTVKSTGSYQNSIGSYSLFVVFWTVAHGIQQRVKMLIIILERPVPVRIIGLQTIGWHHGIGPEPMSLGRIVLQQRAAYNCCIVHDEFYRFGSWSCFELARVVLWILSVRIVNLSGRTLNSLGSYRKSIRSYSEFSRFAS